MRWQERAERRETWRKKSNEARDIIVTGKSGTCVWTLDSKGHLLIAPADGEAGELGDRNLWNRFKFEIESISFAGTVRASENCNSLFEGLENLVSIDMSGFDTSQTMTMASLFEGCSSLKSVDLSGLDTSQVESMEYMFFECRWLSSATLPPSVPSSVCGVSFMFCDCGSLTTVFASEAWTDVACGQSDIVFRSCERLVGGNGTAFSEDCIGPEYARIDAPGKPGYFTLKE